MKINTSENAKSYIIKKVTLGDVLCKLFQQVAMNPAPKRILGLKTFFLCILTV